MDKGGDRGNQNDPDEMAVARARLLAGDRGRGGSWVLTCSDMQNLPMVEYGGQEGVEAREEAGFQMF